MVRPVSRPREIFWPGGVLQRRKVERRTLFTALCDYWREYEHGEVESGAEGTSDD